MGMFKRRRQTKPKVEVPTQKPGELVSLDVEELAAGRAPHNPHQQLMPQGVTATELVEAARTLPAALEAMRIIGGRFEQFVRNIDVLNRTLGEFKREVMQPLREELHHIRYNTGDRLTQTCNDIDAYVSKLDQVLWGALRAQGLTDEQIRKYRTEHGMQPEAPRSGELAIHILEVEQLRKSVEVLSAQNARLLAQLENVHVFYQGENGWVWHQGCECQQCKAETARIAHAQEVAASDDYAKKVLDRA